MRCGVLVAAGYGWDLPAMTGLGYRQIGQYSAGEVDLDEAVALIKKGTRRFVQQQYNWFRLDDPQIHWLDAGSRWRDAQSRMGPGSALLTELTRARFPGHRVAAGVSSPPAALPAARLFILGGIMPAPTSHHRTRSHKRRGASAAFPRNVWAVSITSFFMDVSSEMVINLLPLFLADVLGASAPRSSASIEGIAEAIASMLKLFSGWFSDRLGSRKWLAVAGYGMSALSKPFFYFAASPAAVAGARWADRVGKGMRTAPRDALVADSVTEKQRGLAFGFHRAADTAGAMVGLIIALGIVLVAPARPGGARGAHLPHHRAGEPDPRRARRDRAGRAGARDVAVKGQRAAPKFAFRSLGKPFMIFMLIVGLFDLGNSSDAFLVLRAQERGLSVAGDPRAC